MTLPKIYIKEGKHFEGLPFFESFKCVHGRPDIDVNPADGNLVIVRGITAIASASIPPIAIRGNLRVRGRRSSNGKNVEI